MNFFAKFDEIPSKTLQDIKETKCHGHTFVRSDGQRENSIPSHKHSLRGGGGGGGGYNDIIMETDRKYEYYNMIGFYSKDLVGV